MTGQSLICAVADDTLQGAPAPRPHHTDVDGVGAADVGDRVRRHGVVHPHCAEGQVPSGALVCKGLKDFLSRVFGNSVRNVHKEDLVGAPDQLAVAHVKAAAVSLELLTAKAMVRGSFAIACGEALPRVSGGLPVEKEGGVGDGVNIV
eukprot:CAMPEP_0172032956 /NCGR_PEP_ID=MMETSP1041-20130122/20167_1 /TAXON_ID=464988 /ORGANISM="Hemiselmis andersenii, Strain CCMP439" /LENGTH=147 /DNA_ID=CAMNT_0012689673 /DNA_START=423 /DNA_END=865 /DNA_ORIENTATION=+